jgi:hypothetical protein
MNVTSLADFQRSRGRSEMLKEKADDLEQALALYLRALASGDPGKIEMRLNELKYARNAYVAFRRDRG